MGKTKKELLSSAPWRGDEGQDENKFKDGKVRVTSQPGSESTMHVPRKKKSSVAKYDEDDDAIEIDPQLRYSFQRNYQVLCSIEFVPLVFFMQNAFWCSIAFDLQLIGLI